MISSLHVGLALAVLLGGSPRCSHTQAFVPAPRLHGDRGTSARGRGYTAAHDGSVGCLARGWRGRRSNACRSDGVMFPVMRARRSGGGGDVCIEGAGGETLQVKTRRTRRPDLRAIQGIGMQAAVVAAAGDQQQTLVEETEGEMREEGLEDDEGLSIEDMKKLSRLDKVQLLQREIDTAAKVKPSKANQFLSPRDQYTEIYMPIDGIIIRKTYGFWTWQFIGFCFVQHFVRKFIRKGLDPKKMGAEVNWENVVTEPEHLLELKAYCCENCGYTLFPARGRHEHFFDEVDDFKCPECDSPRSAFYDANDPDDPHNQFDDFDDEEDEPARKAVPDDDDGGSIIIGRASPIARAAKSAPKPQESAPSPSPVEESQISKPPSEPSVDPSEESSEESSDTMSDDVSDSPKESDDGANDDLLDF